jgi:hypothetical protein
MDNAKSLLTINYKLDSAKNFISSVGGNQYYFFVGNHVDANNDVRPFDNQEDTIVSSYQGMIFGKRIQSNDTNLMIRRITWQSNTVYDIYDHRDSDLYDKDFYVVVHEGTTWNVFKVLENNSGGPSTVSPSITNVGIDQEDFFYPTDGYRWKFMYSMTDANETKFATSDYFPVATSANVAAKAVPGAIDSIQVVTPGRGYDNYFSGSFGIADIRLNGDPKKYGISTAGINTTNGYYDACWLYISSGPGAGQYRLVDTYSSNATHNVVFLTEEFDPTDLPQNGSHFELTPSVKIDGDGRETLPASARAIINPAGNTIARVEMIERGQNYFHATGEVQASGSVGVQALAGVVPIMSPVKGHGADAEAELGGKFVGVAVKLIGTEGNTIITDNDYSQVGIIKDPLFNSVKITLKNANKDFFTDEIVYKVSTIQLSGTVQTVLNGNSQLTDSLTVAGVNAHAIATVGQTILINYSTNFQLANVISVSNTSIQMDQAALWDTAGNTANIYLATVGGSGLVSGFSASVVTLTDATGTFTSNDFLIGSETGVHAQANVVTINGASKTFSTFMQTYEYIGSMTQGVIHCR